MCEEETTFEANAGAGFRTGAERACRQSFELWGVRFAACPASRLLIGRLLVVAATVGALGASHPADADSDFSGKESIRKAFKTITKGVIAIKDRAIAISHGRVGAMADRALDICKAFFRSDKALKKEVRTNPRARPGGKVLIDKIIPRKATLCRSSIVKSAIVGGTVMFILGVALATQAEQQQIMRSTNCDLLSGYFAVDPAQAKKVIPEGFELALEKRKAILRLYVSGACEANSVGDEDASSLSTAQWVLDIEGPPELPRIEGAKHTPLTRHHYLLEYDVAGNKSEKEKLVAILKDANLPAVSADKIDMTPVKDIAQAASLVGQLLKGASAVSWTADIQPAVGMLGAMFGVKVTYVHQTESGELGRMVTESLLPRGGNGPLQLSAPDQTIAGRAFGDELTGKAVEVTKMERNVVYVDDGK